jgi:anthranilate synthase component 2
VAVLVIDNYDSFTYNIVHYAESFTNKVVVWRNDEIDLLGVAQFEKIIISPGPGLPDDAGKLMELIEMYHESIPMLGICLGHQALGVYFGAQLYNLEEVKHGLQVECIKIKESILFDALESPILVGLYHSWALSILSESTLNTVLVSENNVIMAFEHKLLPIFGVQFHPESILTPNGKLIIQKFLTLTN